MGFVWRRDLKAAGWDTLPRLAGPPLCRVVSLLWGCSHLSPAAPEDAEFASLASLVSPPGTFRAGGGGPFLPPGRGRRACGLRARGEHPAGSRGAGLTSSSTHAWLRKHSIFPRGPGQFTSLGCSVSSLSRACFYVTRGLKISSCISKEENF